VATAYGQPDSNQICGVTNANARVCAQLAEHDWFQFFSKSPRYVDPTAFGELLKMPMNRAVGVFVGGTRKNSLTRQPSGVRCVQLHGDISPAIARQLAPSFV